MISKKSVFAAALILTCAALPALHAATAAENWETHCTSCHGKDGKGKTTLGRKSGAKDLTDKAYQAKFTDEVSLKDIKEGMKDKKGVEVMDAFGGKLSDKEIKELIAYVRALAK